MPDSDPNANIHSMNEFEAMDRSVEVLIVDSNACNDPSIIRLDLSSFKDLRVFTVGDYSFAYVEELKLIDPYSFDNCSLCEIENDDSLEVIEIGEPEIGSHNFLPGDFELKSDS